MDNYYNSNMYLSTDDLNNIENRIESLTNEIQERVFDNQSSPLRNIQVGDNLNGKVLYLSFPKDIYQYIDNDNYYPIFAGDNMILVTKDENITNSFKIEVDFLKNYDELFTSQDIYNKPISSSSNVKINTVRVILPYNFGIVDEISTNNEFYKYIKIYADERIIPDYIKHTYFDNEVITMQRLDNIERGIANIGYYFYKPIGWQNAREWLGTSDTNNGVIKNGTNIQNISYQDVNRWINNLNLINFDNLDNMTIWNSNVTQLQWNKNSNIEWEEL